MTVCVLFPVLLWCFVGSFSFFSCSANCLDNTASKDKGLFVPNSHTLARTHTCTQTCSANILASFCFQMRFCMKVLAHYRTDTRAHTGSGKAFLFFFFLFFTALTLLNCQEEDSQLCVCVCVCVKMNHFRGEISSALEYFNWVFGHFSTF